MAALFAFVASYQINKTAPSGRGSERRKDTIMANKALFATIRGMLMPAADAIDHEGAPAYAFSPKHALAQYAATGCFGRTFYATAEEQLTRVLELCRSVEPEFVAQTAIYARRHSYMKDMPALLCAFLSTRDARLHEAVFAHVIDGMDVVKKILLSPVSPTKGEENGMKNQMLDPEVAIISAKRV